MSAVNKSIENLPRVYEMPAKTFFPRVKCLIFNKKDGIVVRSVEDT
jgi:hypothetical protein